MEATPSILIIARSGHDRRSLAAFLKTLGRLEWFPCDGTASLPAASSLTGFQPPDLVVADLGSLDRAAMHALSQAAARWPAARRLALVDDIRHVPQARALGADCTLPRSAPAGELLRAARRMSIPA